MSESAPVRKLIDLSFLDIIDKSGPESDEVQKLMQEGEADKIISRIANIINGENVNERADLRRELRELSDYKKGALIAFVHRERSLDEGTKRSILVLVGGE